MPALSPAKTVSVCEPEGRKGSVCKEPIARVPIWWRRGSCRIEKPRTHNKEPVLTPLQSYLACVQQLWSIAFLKSNKSCLSKHPLDQVRLEGNAGPVVSSLAGGDLGGALLAHVGAEHLHACMGRMGCMGMDSR